MNRLILYQMNQIPNKTVSKVKPSINQVLNTDRQILMRRVCLQNYAPLQDGQRVVVMATTIQFTSTKRVMSAVLVCEISRRSVHK